MRWVARETQNFASLQGIHTNMHIAKAAVGKRILCSGDAKSCVSTLADSGFKVEAGVPDISAKHADEGRLPFVV